MSAPAASLERAGELPGASVILHAAIEFADPTDGLRALQRAGIRIAKLQLSAGPRPPDVTAASVEAVKPFAEGTYLHQVI